MISIQMIDIDSLSFTIYHICAPKPNWGNSLFLYKKIKFKLQKQAKF